MHIERVQIEEGFLDGLDLRLMPGLNVIIGERGTGKTSLIELIRFCLDVPGYTVESSRKSREHALSVLGSGQVTITVKDAEQAFTVMRQSSDGSPRILRSFPSPIIFSQSEIESVGLQPNGRLNLIDEFIPHLQDSIADEQMAISEVRSLMSECTLLGRELEQLERQLAELPNLEQQLKELLPQEQKLEQISSQVAEKKKRADIISNEIASISVGASAVDRLLSSLERWLSDVRGIERSAPRQEVWPKAAGVDPLTANRERVLRALTHIQSAASEISAATKEAKAIAQDIAARRSPLDEQARKLRKEVEALQSGAGTTVRLGSQLRERQAQLESLRMVIDARRKTLAATLTKRNRALDQLELSREKRSKKRAKVASELNSALGPRIRVSLNRAGQHEKFSAVLTDILRGSGLRYNELAPALAKSVSPRELLEYAESNNFESLASSARISRDRALRTIAQLRESGMPDLATVTVEDDVSLNLLDGQDYKEIGQLSTGQRCTVILPLVLSHTERVLIVDQPEDHIDNAFIADTVIRAIIARSQKSQILFSTHNANIPVLGNADKVVHMSSDGHRGFVVANAPLQDPAIVQSISTVMEGGAEAFKKRALFYGEHELS